MEPRSSSSKDSRLKVIQWEDFEQELATLSSLSSALQQAQLQKLAIQRQLQTLIQVSGLFNFRIFYQQFRVVTVLESCRLSSMITHL